MARFSPQVSTLPGPATDLAGALELNGINSSRLAIVGSSTDSDIATTPKVFHELRDYALSKTIQSLTFIGETGTWPLFAITCGSFIGTAVNLIGASPEVRRKL